METINERLKAIRGTRSQHDMAVSVGVNPASAKQNWSYWERPGNVIPISKGMILAESEGLTLDWIYRGIK